MTIESAWELQARPQAGAAAAGRAEGGGGAESDALMPLASSKLILTNTAPVTAATIGTFVMPEIHPFYFYLYPKFQ